VGFGIEGFGDGVAGGQGGDFEGEAQGELIGTGGGGQEVLVGEAGQVLGCDGGDAGDAGGKPGLRGDGDLGAASGYGVVDAVGGVLDRGGDDRSCGGEGEPALLFFRLTGVLGVDFAAGAHEARADGGDTDAFVAEFGVEALGEADESELAGDVGEQVGHGELAADAGDVDDGGVAEAGFAAEQVRQRGVGGVEGGEEVGGHGAAVGGDGLVFDGADLDDAGIVDEDVDAAEVADGVFDEESGLGGVGEVGGDEEDVVGGLNGLMGEEGVAGAGELVEIAGGENEPGAGAGVAFGQCEAEAAGAAGDENNLAGTALCGAGHQSVGSGCGGDAGEELHGLEGGSGLFHGFW